MEERIKEIIADVLDIDSVAVHGGMSMDTVEAWSSLTHITLCLSLEQDFDVSFTVDEMESMVSYDDIVRVLSAKRT
jgi:acyl carrier protein